MTGTLQVGKRKNIFLLAVFVLTLYIKKIKITVLLHKIVTFKYLEILCRISLSGFRILKNTNVKILKQMETIDIMIFLACHMKLVPISLSTTIRE
jgi:hypothetical protein